MDSSLTSNLTPDSSHASVMESYQCKNCCDGHKIENVGDHSYWLTSDVVHGCWWWCLL